MNNKITEANYTSRDLTIVAYLVASGFQLESYRMSKDGLMLFTFPNSIELQQHISNFYRMTASINPVVYSNALRNLKTMVRSGRHNENEVYEEAKETMHNLISQR